MEHPPVATAWKAIDTYLAHAYPAAPPRMVAERLKLLRADASFYDSPAFERAPATEPLRLSLRLGNRVYPHMKLVIEKSPLGDGCLFRVDTHDRHACPEQGTPDYEAFCALMALNEGIASAIEAGWKQLGLPTFKTLLREDLARRSQPQRA